MKTGYQTTFIRNFSMEGDEEQNALICFCNGRFDKCVFLTKKMPYTMEDWKFLRDVAAKIIEMEAEEKFLWEKVSGL